MKKIEMLSEEQIRRIYRERMKKDFPDNERKPLEMILKGRKEGQYDCLGLMESGEILAYAFLVRKKKKRAEEEICLLDYLAVAEERRGSGIGSEMLRMLSQTYPKEVCILAEVEDPDEAGNETEHRMQERRFFFYLRNGFRDTGLRVRTFFVDYRILEREGEKKHTREEMKRLYKALYRDMVPFLLYLKMIRVKETGQF